MANVQMEEIVDHLSSEVRRALENAIRATMPRVNFDSYQLFREFRRAIGRKCNSWEYVPDHCVRVD